MTTPNEITHAATESALDRLNASGINIEQETPLERLRFFCSLAMSGQDWLDVEQFFDAVSAAAPVAQEPVGWQFYQDGKWYNGSDMNNHRANTEAAGIPTRDVYAAPVAAQAQQVTCGDGCACVTQCGDTYDYQGVPKPVVSQSLTAQQIADAARAMGATALANFAQTEANKESLAQSLAQQPVSGADGLPLMRRAFYITEQHGNPDPAKQSWRIVFKFREAEAMHAAEAEWRAFIAASSAQPQPSGSAGEGELAAFESWWRNEQLKTFPPDYPLEKLEGWGGINRMPAKKGWDARAALAAQASGQDREDAYIPEERSNYTPSITDCDAVIAQREGYTEGWNDCRQDVIDHARRVEGANNADI